MTMHPNLQKLAEESGLHDDLCSYCPAKNLEKFARLLINECAIIANEKEENFPQYDPNISVNWYIKKHFGVD